MPPEPLRHPQLVSWRRHGSRLPRAPALPGRLTEAGGSDMDLVLTKLKDFSSKPTRFADWGGRRSSQPGVCKRQSCPGTEWDPQGKRQRVDMEKALDWLKAELMEMRSQNQILVKQLMELHAGIQELKKEYDSDRELSDSESDSEAQGVGCCSDSGDGGSLNPSHPNHGQQAATPQRQNRRNSLP